MNKRLKKKFFKMKCSVKTMSKGYVIMSRSGVFRPVFDHPQKRFRLHTYARETAKNFIMDANNMRRRISYGDGKTYL